MTLYSSLLIKNLLHEYVFVAAGLKNSHLDYYNVHLPCISKLQYLPKT